MAVVARHAASLVVLREDMAMLMGVRAAGHRFMPNRWVFPGGAVDRADAASPVASGLPRHVRALVERSATPVLAQAIAVAAARELREETGLSLGHPPALAGLDYLGRMITPLDSPIRFNARFFVVGAAEVTGEARESRELERLRWLRPEEALALDLARPTRTVVRLLQEWLAMTPGQRAGRRRAPAIRNRSLSAE